MTIERIQLDPAIMMGKPVIRGTRITVELILRKMAEGESEAQLLEDYPHLTAQPRTSGQQSVMERSTRRSCAPSG